MIQCTSCNALYDGAQMGSCPVCGSRSARAVIAAIPPAPELERLRAENEALRKALNKIASWAEGDEVNGSFDEPGPANFAFAAGRKAGMEEAEALARSMFNGAANGDEIADAIHAAMEADK